MRGSTLLYIYSMRLPTEKAHGLQMMENCDACAAAGGVVTFMKQVGEGLLQVGM